MEKIFISYRRNDEPFAATFIYTKLTQYFGNYSTFKDIDNIPPGVNFKDYIQEKVEQCKVVLVLIGKNWIHARNDRGHRRLEEPTDMVRLEIESAIERRIPIIPILLNDAMMPKPEELPNSISNLPFYQGITIRPGPDFDNDLQRLVNSLLSYLSLQIENSVPAPETTIFRQHIELQDNHVNSDYQNEIRYDEKGVIINAEELIVEDVVKKKILCPLCKLHVFQEWPYGWDAHAANTCKGIEEHHPEQRKTEYKNRLQYLFIPSFSIHVLRTTETNNDKIVQPQIYQELMDGRARFGWSYEDNGDLRVIRQAAHRTEKQNDIWEKTNFLLNIRSGDYLIYINLPEYDICQIARVTGDYYFDEGIYCEDFSIYADKSRDFRHCFPTKFVGIFSRKDNNIPTSLVKRLKIRGRYWQIRNKLEFYRLLKYILLKRIE